MTMQHGEPTLTRRQHAAIQAVIYWADQAGRNRQYVSGWAWLVRRLRTARMMLGSDHVAYQNLRLYLEQSGFHAAVEEAEREQ